jgi:AAA+ ATPase superfamily predicted ATPase
MLLCIMNFLDRERELDRLESLARQTGGGLAVVYGRRRVGKTRLLLEWTTRRKGLYFVADLSSAEVQRRYLAAAVSKCLPGFADVVYPDWRALLTRLAREARTARWHGPVVLDELPYLVVAAPELPSVLQQWIDHEARQAALGVAVCGSSQRMMQGLCLGSSAPLYGRAAVVLDLQPLGPEYAPLAFGRTSSRGTVELRAAWGGVPRYWELAAAESGPTPSRIDRLVLDPLGPLHEEPDRLLLEEIPSALEVRPVLDAIGAGAHRVSEIASRVGRPATSLSRPLERLVGMGLVRRETPFGESPRSSRRSLYRIADPFFRLWFRVVASNRSLLATASPKDRARLLAHHWDALCAETWEELCRDQLAKLSPVTPLGRLGPWLPASRWWHGGAPEWDLVSESEDGTRLLLGEAKWSSRPFNRSTLARAAGATASRSAPPLARAAHRQTVRALFVPDIAPGVPTPPGVLVVKGQDIFAS